MEFEILGGQLPYVVCKMQAGEKMVSESSGLHWKTPGVGMETSMKGGLLGGLTRSLQGESAFLNIFTSSKDNDEIAFSSSFPGQIVHIKLEAGQYIIAQKGAFLAGSESVKLSMHFKKKLGVGLFGGEGFILNKIEGPGDVFLEIDGALAERNLAAGETLLVDTGHVGLFESSVQHDVEMMKGFKNIFFGGEGLFLAKLTGPGKVWIQSLSAGDIAKSVQPFMPSK